MNDTVSQYDNEVMITEVGMPWMEPIACKQFSGDIISKTKQVSENRGLIVFY